ncbi:oxygen-independent coproporphyrinogen-3 oxidase [Natronocella acetinitrilica]|uniref:Heme chaperone HemW n=1 Tax=Natronocella acetinitrilica TaxID=414046 RepID=A0AAE3G5F1_9GAMM|nr:radical SAM family heme chaperone HemW [Natronocella acetinitrilica]MCP1675359.1 oxygen-independent coproporphyrinogen-3 oxidase [Natronocella acetinitrilica]
MAEPSPPLGLYIHLPWCVHKCPYCDFNSHALRGELPHDRYTEALLLDLQRELSRAPGRSIETIFIGGGTPSLFPPEQLARILAAVGERLSDNAEITLEANPGAVEQGRFSEFRAAGIHRLSIGVQSFQAHLLQRLDRIHGADEARRAAETARAAGFQRFNLDLMFALPGQSLEEALADVDEALALQAPHVSHYQLTIEPNTVFYRRPPALPDEELAWQMQTACGERLQAGGLTRYEVSAWATPGQTCRHNLNYWRFGDYLAVGAGAHGKITDPASGEIRRYRKAKVPELYIQQSLRGSTEAAAWAVPVAERPLEFLMNALRLTQGFRLDDFAARTNLPAATLREDLQPLVAEGLLVGDGAHYRASRRGYDHLDGLLQRFLPETSP